MNNMRKWMNLVEAAETKSMTADEVLLGLKEKDPTTIQFAQSVGVPPAVITQYGELAQQVEQEDIPRKVKIAFLNAEEQIADFIEKKISQVSKGLSKKISRRDLFRGAGNLAQVLSTLSTASKLMQALPKAEPKVEPGLQGAMDGRQAIAYRKLTQNIGIKTFYMDDWYDWMSDATMEDFELIHEEWDSYDDQSTFIKMLNDFIQDYGMPDNSPYKIKILDIFIGNSDNLNRGQIPEMRYEVAISRNST